MKSLEPTSVLARLRARPGLVGALFGFIAGTVGWMLLALPGGWLGLVGLPVGLAFSIGLAINGWSVWLSFSAGSSLAAVVSGGIDLWLDRYEDLAAVFIPLGIVGFAMFWTISSGAGFAAAAVIRWLGHAGRSR